MEASSPNQPIFPFDVLEAIVHEITAQGSDNEAKGALKAFCLLSKQCVPLAQKHIFASITITDDIDRLQRLQTLLQDNASIALYIQKVMLIHRTTTHIRILDDPRLHKILHLLKRVNSLSLCNLSGWILDWRVLSSETKAAIYSLMESKCMESLSVLRIKNLPLLLIQIAPRLSMLALTGVSVVVEPLRFPSEPQPIAPILLHTERPSSVTSLKFAGRIDFPIGLIDLRSVRSFKFEPLDISDLSNALHLISSPPAQSLESVTYSLAAFRYGSNSPTLAGNFDLNQFPSLRYFTIKMSISKISSSIFPTDIAQVLYSAPLSGSKLEEFRVILDDDLLQTEKYVPYVSEAEWERLDEAITSQRFTLLRRVVFEVILGETRVEDFDVIGYALTVRLPLISASSSIDLLFEQRLR